MPSKSITVIDDDDAVRDSLQAFLETAGYNVTAFASGREYLASPAAGRERLLIVDFQMPDLDGIAVMERLRAQGGEAAIIMITGKAESALGELARQASAIAVLRKPLRNPEFLDTVRAAIASPPATRP